ncbi:heme peroxidase [Aspergillus avenaceus]|uniref:Heme peroxidase n=1 Tax=Aspergillus avenaceus TaxID=36643 RepID=A0A5N6TYE3_ASPAV|nr:heme peroxidase [Aspergillus avenaceus]
MEIVISMVSSLPRGSKTRTKLTNSLINGLWDSLEHPPISFLGNEYQYRTADGSNNNIHFPDLGKANMPYAKSIQSQTFPHGVQPDPGLLFDLCMKRETFRENEAGISSVLFHHAAIIIHDLFHTDPFDQNRNLCSSYLDLAPLYGSSHKEQMAMRTREKGLLKADCFSDKRLLGQPPGVATILILYNRFHNYVAQMLLQVNEGGRFTGMDEHKQDEDLFQTARLITGGLYINISMHDYLRAITNVHQTGSNWTLDPRVEIPNNIFKQGTERGIGNHVSAEFNLLYRFHPAISQQDEAWISNFFDLIFDGQPPDEIEIKDFVKAAMKFEKSIPDEPEKRGFQKSDNIERGPDGRFKDADLVRVLKDSIEAPAGSFGPKHVPAAMRIIEIVGIKRSREWRSATLNEFRKFFKLQPHQTFEDISVNPDVSDALSSLYGHPDLVESYPGLWIEDAKPRMDPGSGFCAPYTVGRAVLSDAVTLVRSDRFNTKDYHVGNLTSWGMAEVQQDYETLGGSMFYKLIQRTLPGWFPYNSLHAMQPMYTKNMNREIATKLGTIGQYSEADPKPPKAPVMLEKYVTIKEVLNDPKRFPMPLGFQYFNLLPDHKVEFMLGGDLDKHRNQRNLVGNLLYGSGDLKSILHSFLNEQVEAHLNHAYYQIGKKTYQFDFVKDVAIPVLTRFLADLFLLDLKTDENPSGSYDIEGLYKDIHTMYNWGYDNTDPANSWNLRRKAQQAFRRLLDSAKKTIRKEANAGLTKAVSTTVKRAEHLNRTPTLREFGREFIGQLVAKGKPKSEISDIMIFTPLGAIGPCVTEAYIPKHQVTKILHYLIAEPGNTDHIQNLLTRFGNGTDKAHHELRRYVLELQRFVTSEKTLRLTHENCTVQGQKFKKGDLVICDLAAASRDPAGYPDPEAVKLDRPLHDYMAYAISPHQCIGQSMAVSYMVAMLRGVLKLKNLRPAPGPMGELKRVIVPGVGEKFLSEDWSTIIGDAQSWKLQFENDGMGILGAST